MGFISLLKAGFDLIRYKPEALIDIQHDPVLYKTALMLVAIPSIITGILSMDILLFLLAVVMTLVMFITLAGITHGVARMFGGDTYFGNTISALAASGFYIMLIIVMLNLLALAAPGYLTVVLYILAAIYLLSVQAFIIKNLYTLPYWKAILVMLVPVVFSSFITSLS